MPFPVGVKVGDTVVAVGEVQNNIGGFHPDGTEFLVCSLDDQCLELTPHFDEQLGTWFYTDDFATFCGMIDNQLTIKGE